MIPLYALCFGLREGCELCALLVASTRQSLSLLGSESELSFSVPLLHIHFLRPSEVVTVCLSMMNANLNPSRFRVTRCSISRSSGIQ